MPSAPQPVSDAVGFAIQAAMFSTVAAGLLLYLFYRFRRCHHSVAFNYSLRFTLGFLLTWRALLVLFLTFAVACAAFMALPGALVTPIAAVVAVCMSLAFATANLRKQIQAENKVKHFLEDCIGHDCPVCRTGL